jgi:hypothetical protein
VRFFCASIARNPTAHSRYFTGRRRVHVRKIARRPSCKIRAGHAPEKTEQAPENYLAADVADAGQKKNRQ